VNKFTCSGCWEAAVAKARVTDGDVAGWYRAYHKDAHGRQGLPELRFREMAR
jgi:hypothetical protein